MLKTVEAIAAGHFPQTEQAHFPELKKAPKIFTADCRIDWTKPVTEIYNRVRGLSPYPAAFTYLEDKVLKIFSSKPIHLQHDKKPGTIISDAKSHLRFAAADGFLDVEALQLEGKRRMKTDEFLRGNRLEITRK